MAAAIPQLIAENGQWFPFLPVLKSYMGPRKQFQFPILLTGILST